MSELRELYQTTILDHNRTPKNFRVPEDSNREAEGYNPLCGDKVTIYLTVVDDTVQDVGFQGTGCAISTASASMMTQAVKGRPLVEVMKIFGDFHNLVTAKPEKEPEVAGVGKLVVFSGVRDYPMRVKCATLPWHTLRAAIENSDEVAKTE
jgi:nitrogen fixation NifU-like protein